MTRPERSSNSTWSVQRLNARAEALGRDRATARDQTPDSNGAADVRRSPDRYQSLANVPTTNAPAQMPSSSLDGRSGDRVEPQSSYIAASGAAASSNSHGRLRPLYLAYRHQPRSIENDHPTSTASHWRKESSPGRDLRDPFDDPHEGRPNSHPAAPHPHSSPSSITAEQLEEDLARLYEIAEAFNAEGYDDSEVQEQIQQMERVLTQLEIASIADRRSGDPPYPAQVGSTSVTQDSQDALRRADDHRQARGLGSPTPSEQFVRRR